MAGHLPGQPGSVRKPIAKRQLFEVGFALNTWDFGAGTLEDGFACIRDNGFSCFEGLLGDSLTLDQARLYHQVGDLRLPAVVRDHELMSRLSTFSRAQTEFGLRLSSLYVNPHWIEPVLWPVELDMIRAVARFLQGCGARVMVGGGGPPARVGRHSPEDYHAFARALGPAARETAAIGVGLAYHPHLDCFVESRDELDRLMDCIGDAEVGLCLDPAHLQATGGNPVDALETYFDHVQHVHLKDWRGDVGATGRAATRSRRSAKERSTSGRSCRCCSTAGTAGTSSSKSTPSTCRRRKAGRTARAYLEDALGVTPVPAGQA